MGTATASLTYAVRNVLHDSANREIVIHMSNTLDSREENHTNICSLESLSVKGVTILLVVK